MLTFLLNTTNENRYNCVKYARSLKPNLPFGLWTILDKIKIVNSCTPKIGAIAVINTGLPWGHLGVVEEIKSSSITIDEANFQFGKITRRIGTATELKILGYFV